MKMNGMQTGCDNTSQERNSCTQDIMNFLTATEMTADENNSIDNKNISTAIMPLSSSLPSKLLRLLAKQLDRPLRRPINKIFLLDSHLDRVKDFTDFSYINETAVEFDRTSRKMLLPIETALYYTQRDSSVENHVKSSSTLLIEGTEKCKNYNRLQTLPVQNHLSQNIDLNALTALNNFLIVREELSPAMILSEEDVHKIPSHKSIDNENIDLNKKYENKIDHKLDKIDGSSKKIRENDPYENYKSVILDFFKHPVSNQIDTLKPDVIPSTNLIAEIVEAVEFYFSNESILKDAFLLKHVRRNKEGFVSLKLISSFKRVRQLTKEWKVVGYAVHTKSKKVVLNSVGTKVRRLESLPTFDETMPSRTIVVCDLPFKKITIENVSDMFSKYGELALVRILKPGMLHPIDVRQFMNKYPEMQNKECALIEYLKSNSARVAKNMQGSFRVYDMVAAKKKTVKKVFAGVNNCRHHNDDTSQRAWDESSGRYVLCDKNVPYKLTHNNLDFAIPSFPPPSNHNYHTKPELTMKSTQKRSGSFDDKYLHQSQQIYSRDRMKKKSTEIQKNIPWYYHNTAKTIAMEDIVTTEHSNSTSKNVNDFNYSKNSEVSSTEKKCLTGSVEKLSERRCSSCSDTACNASSIIIRHPFNCLENIPKKECDSYCSDNCFGLGRVSAISENDKNHKALQGSYYNGERRFSNGAVQFNSLSNASSELGSGDLFHRRMSYDENFDYKQSKEVHNYIPYKIDGHIGNESSYNISPRRFSNNPNPKITSAESLNFFNERRLSSDSGYDRRYSYSSEYEGSPRSFSGTFLTNYISGSSNVERLRSRSGSFLDGSPRSRSGSFALRNIEHLLRTPFGPDGSKGFAAREKKLGQTIA